MDVNKRQAGDVTILDLKGKIELAPGYDYKSLRADKR